MNKKFIINEFSTIKDALIAINDITHDGESLVVINSEQEIMVHLRMEIFVEVLLLEQN